MDLVAEERKTLSGHYLVPPRLTVRASDCVPVIWNTNARLPTWAFLIAEEHRKVSATHSRSSLAAWFFVFAFLVQCLVRQEETEESQNGGAARNV